MSDALSERQADAVLESDLAIDEAPTWGLQGGWWKADLPVRNVHQLDLRMKLSVSSRFPGKYTFHLMRGSQTLRRLDVRGSHWNHGRNGSDESWLVRTHKHRLTDTWADGLAYTPTDLPQTTGAVAEPVAPGEYRSVFEGFCNECNIDTTDEWADPGAEQPQGGGA